MRKIGFFEDFFDIRIPNTALRISGNPVKLMNNDFEWKICQYDVIFFFFPTLYYLQSGSANSIVKTEKYVIVHFPRYWKPLVLIEDCQNVC